MGCLYSERWAIVLPRASWVAETSSLRPVWCTWEAVLPWRGMEVADGWGMKKLSSKDVLTMLYGANPCRYVSSGEALTVAIASLLRKGKIVAFVSPSRDVVYAKPTFESRGYERVMA